MQIEILQNEYWWGGIGHHGSKMPFSSQSEYSANLTRQSAGNQSAPFFLSSKGRYLWCEEPFSIRFSGGEITAEAPVGELVLEQLQRTLRGAYQDALRRFFPPGGGLPPDVFFAKPQYNTWAELTYQQNQQSILRYARDILANGYAPGIFIIDDTWQADYGAWRFEPGRFPAPKEMLQQLRDLGFSVMLWVCPFVSPDSMEFRELCEIPGGLLRTADGAPAILPWWNGYSACLDMAQPGGRGWLADKLNGLMQDYGIDGFKFDDNGFDDYADALAACPGHTPAGLAAAWINFAAGYPFHEVKNTWKAGGRPLVQRLRDKAHRWDGEGLSCIIPDAIALSLTGHSFLCPDMVGGGEWTNFVDGFPLDEELFVRLAQCAVFFPMMQFSAAPWRVLSPANAALVKVAHDLRQTLAPRILALARESARTGEPMLRPLCYSFPDGGYETLTTQFMLGEDILAAPVLQKGVKTQMVLLPPGVWQAADGTLHTGPAKLELAVQPESIPHFFRCGGV